MALALVAGAGALPGDAATKTTVANKYFVTSDGVRLHYIETGRGTTILFVPGWTMPAEIWQPQIDHFSCGFRVVALDPRSQGKSRIAANGHNAERRARDIKELLDALGAAPVVMVGWSLGVLEALSYVRRYGSERIVALVLVDNSVGEEPPPSFDPTFLRRLQEDRQTTTESFVRGMFRGPQSEEYLRRLIRHALKTPTPAAVALLRSPQSREFWRQIIYSVDKPVLYVVTERFKEQALNLRRHKPEVRIDIFEHAGHALFVDEPERFNDLLEGFLMHVGAVAAPCTRSP